MSPFRAGAPSKVGDRQPVADGRHAPVHGADCVERAVDAAVLDKDDLVAPERSKQLLEHRAHRRDVLHLVVGGNHDRDVRSGTNLCHDRPLFGLVRTTRQDLHSE